MVYGHIYGRQVYSIVTDGRENHPWLIYHSSKLFTNPEMFEAWISNERYRS